MNDEKKKQYKTILFIAGLVVIALAAVFLPLGFLPGGRSVYFWINLFLIYVVLFFPFAADLIHNQTLDALFAAGSLYYRAVRVYIILSVILLLLDITNAVSMAFLIIGLLVAALVFGVYVFLCGIAGGHMQQQQQQHQDKKAMLNQLKQAAVSLRTQAQSDENVQEKERIEKALDEIRYLSPASDENAVILEEAMTSTIQRMIRNQRQGNPVDEDLSKLQELIAQRKAMY